MKPLPNARSDSRFGVWGAVFLGCLLSYGCVSQPTVQRRVLPVNSPVAEEVTPVDTWRLAEAFAATHERCAVVVGSGDSMLPLYRDRTVLVLQTMEMSQLRCGMTVVFLGDRGRPVAHMLLEFTPRGWIAMGTGNLEPDSTPVRSRNYISTVVKTYAPNPHLGSPVAQSPTTARVRMASSGD